MAAFELAASSLPLFCKPASDSVWEVVLCTACAAPAALALALQIARRMPMIPEV
jgi:hypothetical protein